MGRVARMLTQGLPPSIEVIILEPMKAGIPVSAVTLRRSDLEALETSAGGSADMFERAVFADAGASAGLLPVAPADGPFTWSLGPYLGLVFGPEDDDGLALNGGSFFCGLSCCLTGKRCSIIASGFEISFILSPYLCSLGACLTGFAEIAIEPGAPVFQHGADFRRDDLRHHHIADAENDNQPENL